MGPQFVLFTGISSYLGTPNILMNITIYHEKMKKEKKDSKTTRNNWKIEMVNLLS